MKLFLFVIGFICSNVLAAQSFPYQNANLPVEHRVADLVARMSLAEKVRQMDMYNGAELKLGGDLNEAKLTELLADELGIGSIHDLYPESAAQINALQEQVISSNRWGIPALIFCEFLHGYTGKGSTAFPMNIGLGASWDKNLMTSVGKAIATEGRAHGVHFGLGPNLDLGREPRWGRIAETFGEDTHLAASLGTALIQGIQGDDLSAKTSMIAEPKHFVAHGSPQAGGNAGPVLVGERSLRSEFLPVFKKAFKEGGALGTMAAYSEIDGIPMASNKEVLTHILKEEWGFEGIVVSDLGAIRFLRSSHRSTASNRESIKMAIDAGIDMQFYDFPNEEFQSTIIELVEAGELPEERITDAASRVLRLKFMLGLFEEPYTNQELIDEQVHNESQQALALEAALKSMVLLKNDQDILPLNKNQVKKIALIGPLADESVLGGYSVREATAMTVLEGLHHVLGDEVEVIYEEAIPLIYKGQLIPGAYFSTPDKKSQGLLGTYFNNRDLDGTPVLTKIDEQIDFEWEGSPAESVNADHFSIRWEGYLTLEEDFDGWLAVSSDDGVRLSIENEWIIDNWRKGATNVEIAQVQLKANRPYRLIMDMWEGGYGAKAQLFWNKEKPNLSKALSAVKEADATILVLGESTELVEENKDVASLDLYGLQNELIKEVAQVGKPFVSVLYNGRPLAINQLVNQSSAILEAWFPGEKGGEAIAKTLFGEYNPGGKLPVTFPRSVGQIPIYYSAKPTRNHRYVDEKISPLFPFGYGLSYTNFVLDSLNLEPLENGFLNVKVRIKNTGDLTGDEVVQVYMRDLVSSVTTPIKKLVAFERITLKAGEERLLRFRITPEDLALWNREMKQVVEAGDFELMIGNSASTSLSKRFNVKRSIYLEN